MSKALAVVADEIGPDNVIFPSLRNQAFLDLAMKEIYSEIPLETAGLSGMPCLRLPWKIA